MRRNARFPHLLFADSSARLGPLVDLRSVWDVRTGVRTNRERIAGVVGGDAVATIDGAGGSPSCDDPGGPVLFINGACALPPEELFALDENEAIVDAESGLLVGGVARAGDFRLWADALPSASTGVETRQIRGAGLILRPWDVIRHRNQAIGADLDAIIHDEDRPESSIPQGVTHYGEYTAAISFSATLYPGVTLDTTGGPIVISDHAVVRPGAVLVGPTYIGERSAVLEHSLIKANTAIGPWCKVAGEVGGTIFQGFANKAHDGHLGDSWIGEWVNLGAGTTNSNLLNTYGEIVARTDTGEKREHTGLTFLGSIIGDHVKTAIGTRLMTGSVIGTGSMVASTQAPSTSVGRFVWLTDAGESVFRFDKFLGTAKRVMLRRDVIPDDNYIGRLRALHERTVGGRA